MILVKPSLNSPQGQWEGQKWTMGWHHSLQLLFTEMLHVHPGLTTLRNGGTIGVILNMYCIYCIKVLYVKVFTVNDLGFCHWHSLKCWVAAFKGHKAIFLTSLSNGNMHEPQQLLLYLCVDDVMNFHTPVTIQQYKNQNLTAVSRLSLKGHF